jgi:MFS family permease
LGTLAQAGLVVAASLIGGRLSDRTGRRKIFVLTASTVYGLAMFLVAMASDFNGYLVGMAITGLGLGMYIAVDLVLVIEVLPDHRNTAKDARRGNSPARTNPSAGRQGADTSFWWRAL